jgi:hypothetical protein
VGAFLLVQGTFAQNRITTAAGVPGSEERTPGGCTACAQKSIPEAASARVIPGTSEIMPVGKIENLIPIGVLAALGCEKCAGEAVRWALEQGSSIEDVDRTLGVLTAMQKLDCFKQQFGNDAPARLDKPLAAARKVLQQAIDSRAGQ